MFTNWDVVGNFGYTYARHVAFSLSGLLHKNELSTTGWYKFTYPLTFLYFS